MPSYFLNKWLVERKPIVNSSHPFPRTNDVCFLWMLISSSDFAQLFWLPLIVYLVFAIMTVRWNTFLLSDFSLHPHPLQSITVAYHAYKCYIAHVSGSPIFTVRWKTFSLSGSPTHPTLCSLFQWVVVRGSFFDHLLHCALFRTLWLSVERHSSQLTSPPTPSPYTVFPSRLPRGSYHDRLSYIVLVSGLRIL